jgi:antitoxin VapB
MSNNRLDRFNRDQISLLIDIEEILNRVDALPIVDPRTPDEILDYDENGLPQ